MRISYRYESRVAGRHLVRLCPRDAPGRQRIIALSLDVSPPPRGRSQFVDFFGNTAQSVIFTEPHDEICFRVQARVERLSSGWGAGPGAANLPVLAQDLGLLRDLGAGSPHHYRGRSPLVTPSAEMTAYARDVTVQTAGVREMVRSLGAALFRDMVFDPNATDVDTPPDEAFAARRGVCQDFSHIMIACLRGLGVPAGYVSGLLRTLPPDGQPRLSGADAMHAWVRAWCGAEAGWIEYDPTNALDVDTDHIAVAFGRDYSDVSPVRGVLKANGGHSGRQEIDVIPLEESVSG